MATLRDIRRRIKGVESTQKITKAMKMVAAAKLRRAQDNIINARPYAKKIAEALNHLISDEDLTNNIYLIPKEIKSVAIVVVSADRGLCGSFNTNILKETVRYINEELNPENIEPKFFCVGKKCYDFFRKRNYNVVGAYPGIFSRLKFDIALSISNDVIGKYLQGEFEKVVIIYNEFKSIIQQKIVNEQYLPIPFKQEIKEQKAIVDYIYEPAKKQIFNYMLPKHLNSQMWRVLLESNAAELGARMTAMDNATTNAKELIRSLKLNYNKARQAAITKELLEIVSGANALKGE